VRLEDVPFDVPWKVCVTAELALSSGMMTLAGWDEDVEVLVVEQDVDVVLEEVLEDAVVV
jgi:hypothetical protein